MAREKQFVYKSTLKEVYGLNDALIRSVGEPDKRVSNPHYRCAAPASLYAIERVEQFVEQHADEIELARQRSAKARRATDAKRAELQQWAETVSIEVDTLPDDLWTRAELHYAKRVTLYEDGFAGVGLNGVIAYVRHRFTNYESLLRHLEGRAGCAEAYVVIKARVNEAVKEKLELVLA
jgi:hypothetical protein